MLGGTLNETHSILQRVRERAEQSANGTNTTDNRKAIQDEVTQLKSEIDRIGNTTEFKYEKNHGYTELNLVHFKIKATDMIIDKKVKGSVP